jgi:hypothetical protein
VLAFLDDAVDLSKAETCEAIQALELQPDLPTKGGEQGIAIMEESKGK